MCIYIKLLCTIPLNWLDQNSYLYCKQRREEPLKVTMTAGENPFASNTSSLQSQLKGSSFLLYGFYTSIPLTTCLTFERCYAFFLFLSTEKDKELLAAKAEIEALRTNEELENRAFEEVC